MVRANKRPRGGELVYSDNSDIAPDWVVHVGGLSTDRYVLVCARGRHCGDAGRRYLESKFKQQYRWNSDRGLGGGWEPLP